VDSGSPREVRESQVFNLVITISSLSRLELCKGNLNVAKEILNNAVSSFPTSYAVLSEVRFRFVFDLFR
jgi:hypothetical protein